MNSFMTVGPYIKQLALEEYYRLTQDQGILYAFAASHQESLNATAHYLLNGSYEKVYAAKMNAVTDMNLDEELSPALLVYFIKWGLFAKHMKRHAHGLNEYISKQTYQFNMEYVAAVNYEHTDLIVDRLGLKLLLMLGDKVTQREQKESRTLQAV